jgi:hypothetical protein
MDNRRASRRDDRDDGRPERRATAPLRGLPRVLHLLKNLWARPVGVQRRGRGVKLVLVERRLPRLSDEPPKLSQLRADLRERLLGHEHAHAAQVMRHLARVHDELGRAGWPGVEGLPGQVLGMATVQAEMLASVAPSAVLAHLVERLRICKVAADVREERALLEQRAARARNTAPGEAAEVAVPAESGFDGAAGAWAGPVPVPVVIPDREA